MTASDKGPGGTGAGGDAAKVPRPIATGPEMAALGTFYRDVTWKGVIHAGGMGPGTPAMTGVGHGTAYAIQDGRWIVLDCEQDQFLDDGTFVLKWQLHWVSGWAPEHGEYRAVMTDNYGHADVYRGQIDGDRLIFESMEGPGIRLRFTWDASDLDVITWRNEMTTGDGSWFLIEEYPMVPKSRRPARADSVAPGDPEHKAPRVRNAGRYQGLIVEVNADRHRAVASCRSPVPAVLGEAGLRVSADSVPSDRAQRQSEAQVWVSSSAGLPLTHSQIDSVCVTAKEMPMAPPDWGQE